MTDEKTTQRPDGELAELLTELESAGYDIAVSAEQGGPQDIERAEKRATKAQDAIQSYADDLARKRVVEALKAYGEHNQACPAYLGDVPCECGLTIALTKAQEKSK